MGEVPSPPPTMRYPLLAACLPAAAPCGLGAQAPTIYCMPSAPACFSAQLGFVPIATLPGFVNQLQVKIVNLEGTLGGPPTKFGFQGFWFYGRNVLDVITVSGWFLDPFAVGNVLVNPAPIVPHEGDQPTGVNGFYQFIDLGIAGCTFDPTVDDWHFATCIPKGQAGFVQWNIDLFAQDYFDPRRAATFDDFALVAVTTAGSCTITPSEWFLPNNFGYSPCQARASVTPEPGTLPLLSIPLLALLGLRGRRVVRSRFTRGR